MSQAKPHMPSINCRHCSNVAPMDIVATYSQVSTIDGGDNSPNWDEGDIFELLLCPACNKVMLRKYYYHEFIDGDEHDDFRPVILYPLEVKIPEGLPDVIRKTYQAALKVRSIEANAYAVLLGRVLDKVCEDRSAQGNALFEKLTDLSTRGEIPAKLAKMAHNLRQLRNVGAHADLGELTLDEIPFLDDLCRAVLEYVYSAPLLLQKAEKRLQLIGSGSTIS